MAKMKTNQDGGGESSTAAAGELRNNQKGAAKYDVKKGSHDHPHGASRMGYNQSFGAARVSGYSKGAAKVADIMSFGASKYISGAADKGKPKKNTSGVFGGDEIMKDQNKDGNMVSRGFSSLVEAGKKIGKAIVSDFGDGGAEAKRKLRIDRDPSITK